MVSVRNTISTSGFHARPHAALSALYPMTFMLNRTFLPTLSPMNPAATEPIAAVSSGTDMNADVVLESSQPICLSDGIASLYIRRS
jgi:hypothetical protein